MAMTTNNYGLGNIAGVIDPIGNQTIPQSNAGIAGLDLNNMRGRSGAMPLQGAGAPTINPHQSSNMSFGGNTSLSVPEGLFSSMTSEPKAQSGVGNLERELATIQALRASAPSGGLGQTIGGGLGGAVGAAFGGPVGAAVGSGVGGTVGSVVDYMINSNAQKRAEAKELKARRAQIRKAKAIANAEALKANRQRIRGISESIEQDRMTERERTIQERQMMLNRMMQGLQNKAQYDDFIKNKLLASRSI